MEAPNRVDDPSLRFLRLLQILPFAPLYSWFPCLWMTHQRKWWLLENELNLWSSWLHLLDLFGPAIPYTKNLTSKLEMSAPEFLKFFLFSSPHLYQISEFQDDISRSWSLSR